MVFILKEEVRIRYMNDLNLGVYLVTGQEYSKGRSTLDIVTRAIAGGIGTVQLREKGMSTRELVELGRQVRSITREKGIIFLVNDRVDVALAVEADGVHLGQDDMPLIDARRILGEQAVIGLSVDTPEEAAAAAEEGASYVGLGPVFKTGTKSDTGPVVGPQGVEVVSSRINIPLVAIGGITGKNMVEVLQAGADSVAIVSALTAAEDIEAAAKEMTAAFNAVKG